MNQARRVAAFAAIVLAFTTAIARADDFGPSRDVRDVRWAATRLLAYRYGAITLSDAVVVKDQAILTWRNGKATGVAGFVRYANRWWDVYEGEQPSQTQCAWQTVTFPLKTIGRTNDVFDIERAGFSPELIAAAQTHNAQLRPLSPVPRYTGKISYQPNANCEWVYPTAALEFQPAPVHLAGGLIRNDPAQSGYQAQLSYTGANVAGATMELPLRAPSLGEILPMPIPPKSMGGATSIAFLYVYITAPSPVTLTNTTLNVWVPWVLDDPAHYQIQLFQGKRSIGPLYGTISQNVLHFTLPPFAFAPGEAQGEIDYDW